MRDLDENRFQARCAFLEDSQEGKDFQNFLSARTRLIKTAAADKYALIGPPLGQGK